MIFVIIESLVVKGLITTGKFLATKAALAKATALAAKVAISHYGLGTVLSFTFTTGLVVGKVVWTKEKVDNLRDAIEALQDGDHKRVIWKFANLARSSNTEIEFLPDVIEEYLLKIKVPTDKAEAIAKTITNFESEITEQVKELDQWGKYKHYY